MRNDPAHWGSHNPEILILGFSKGSTQANIFQNGRFEDVAFGGRARLRLDAVTQALGLINSNESISDYIADPDSKIAFGSLVRCSLTRKDANNNWSCTGPLIKKSFTEIPQILNNCVAKYLVDLPSTVRLVVFLGTDSGYIKAVKNVMGLHLKRLKPINSVSFENDGVIYTHAAHPSPGNGHFNSWLDNSEKFKLAREALNTKEGLYNLQRDYYENDEPNLIAKEAMGKRNKIENEVLCYKVTRGKNSGISLTPHKHKDGKYAVSKTRFKRDYIYLESKSELKKYLELGYGVRMSAPGVAPSLIKSIKL